MLNVFPCSVTFPLSRPSAIDPVNDAAGRFVKPDPLVVLRDSSDGDERAKALRALQEPKPNGGTDADHGDDVDLNYEPTVNPVATGGYAWVVFTSRRMYGSVAAIPPFCSDVMVAVTEAALTVAAPEPSSSTRSVEPAFENCR